MGCVNSAQRFLICVLDPLCTSTIKHKDSFRASATERRVHTGSKTVFLNIAFICNTSLQEYIMTNLDV